MINNLKNDKMDISMENIYHIFDGFFLFVRNIWAVRIPYRHNNVSFLYPFTIYGDHYYYAQVNIDLNL